MKKIICSFVLIISVITLSFSAQIKEWISPEKKVGKNLNLTIVHANPYRSRIYNHSTAMLNVVVIRVVGQKMDTLFVKNYPDFKLTKLSSFSKGFNQNIYIPDVADEKEKIVLVYNIIYTTKESVLTIPTVNFIGKGATNDKFIINI